MNVEKYYIETYGCQMNKADSELIAGMLEGFSCRSVDSPEEADIILVNTCTVRENAEKRAISRLSQFKGLKKKNPDLILGLLGCVAQRNRGKIISEKSFIDIVLGPDSYRHLPEIFNGCKFPLLDVKLSRDEVYEGIIPYRRNKINAWISIMRGCDKFCSYCIVPYTRGRERSRSLKSIIDEVKKAIDDGYREVTLLGQNVNSYKYNNYRFPDLLDAVSGLQSVQRVRFISPHPKDIDNKMLELMRDRQNICNHIHLPLQAGSSRVLKSMNRVYSQREYLSVAEKIHDYLSDVAITTDIIVGFPGETEEDFLETLKVMDKVVFDSAFMFKYSPRPGTKAALMKDDVSEEEKADRLTRVIEKQREHTLIRNNALVGSIQEVLIEDLSKKDPKEKMGRTVTNKIVIIKEGETEIGDLVKVKIEKALGVSLFGKIV